MNYLLLLLLALLLLLFLPGIVAMLVIGFFLSLLGMPSGGNEGGLTIFVLGSVGLSAVFYVWLFLK